MGALVVEREHRRRHAVRDVPDARDAVGAARRVDAVVAALAPQLRVAPPRAGEEHVARRVHARPEDAALGAQHVV